MLITNTYNNNYTPKKQRSFLSFKAIERTFAMLKPDAFERKLNDVITKEIENNDFKIIKKWIGTAPREKLENNYIEHKDKSFFGEWMDFLQSGNVQAMAIEGENAVEKFRNFTFEIRNKLAPGERRKNLLHSSDSPDAAKRELENFFDKTV